MKASPADPCPDEMSSAGSCFGPVQDGEILIRFVSERKDLLLADKILGLWKIAGSSFSEDDINGIGSGISQKSVSTFREALTPHPELLTRAQDINVQPEWTVDPVVGKTTALKIRSIIDPAARRNFCVFADKTEPNDPFGVSEAHASIRKSNPANKKHQRQGKAILRSQLSDAFDDVMHLTSQSSQIIGTP